MDVPFLLRRAHRDDLETRAAADDIEDARLG